MWTKALLSTSGVTCENHAGKASHGGHRGHGGGSDVDASFVVDIGAHVREPCGDGIAQRPQRLDSLKHRTDQWPTRLPKGFHWD
jgi:hypothetical protein